MQISKRVHLIKIPFQIPIAPGKTIDRFVNVFLIVGKKIHLVDAGVKGSHKIIFDYIANIGRNKNEIASMFLTHSHPDHIGSAKTIKELTRCCIYANPIEIDWIEDTNKQFRERPVPGFNDLVEGPVKVDELLSPQEVIQLEDKITLEILYTPGHSDGSTSFRLIEEEILFTGDAILLPGEMPIYTNVEKYFTSLELIDACKNIKTILSSWDIPRHGDEISTIINNSKSYVEKIQNAVQKVAENRNDYNSMEFGLDVLNELQLPPIIANPLLLKSFKANLDFSERKNIIIS
jgi:hydroxyacylglutathione hydrolase